MTDREKAVAQLLRMVRNYATNDELRQWFLSEIEMSKEQEQKGWTSVKDRVPEIGTLCLVYDGAQMTVARHVRDGRDGGGRP